VPSSSITPSCHPPRVRVRASPRRTRRTQIEVCITVSLVGRRIAASPWTAARDAVAKYISVYSAARLGARAPKLFLRSLEPVDLLAASALVDQFAHQGVHRVDDRADIQSSELVTRLLVQLLHAHHHNAHELVRTAAERKIRCPDRQRRED